MNLAFCLLSPSPMGKSEVHQKQRIQTLVCDLSKFTSFQFLGLGEDELPHISRRKKCR